MCYQNNIYKIGIHVSPLSFKTKQFKRKGGYENSPESFDSVFSYNARSRM